MNSRERVRRAIHFNKPDHVPHLLPDGQPNDILWLWSKRPDIQPWELGNDGIERRIDIWGVGYERVAGSTLNHGEKYLIPIQNVKEHMNYQFPPLNHQDNLQAVKSAVVNNNSSTNPQYCLGVMPIRSLNEGIHNLIELDQMFIAYYESPNELKSLIKRFADAQLESIRLLAEIGCDGVMGYDDWGLQSALMVKQELIEEFFAPYYQRNWAYAHLLGLDVWLHSCGYIIDLLPKFKAWGLDVIQMDQQENMGLEQLDAVIGGQLAFWCPVDIQKTMVNGSPDDIRAYVRKLRTTVGDHCGGMISMAYSTPTAVGHSAENLAAMCDEFRALPGY